MYIMYLTKSSTQYDMVSYVDKAEQAVVSTSYLNNYLFTYFCGYMAVCMPRCSRRAQDQTSFTTLVQAWHPYPEPNHWPPTVLITM